MDQKNIRSTSALKTLRIPLDICGWLDGLKPKKKHFSAKVIDRLRECWERETPNDK